MTLSYDEFKKLVPEKTKIFFENLCVALYHYIISDNAVILKNASKTKDNNIRELASIIYAMSYDDDYAPSIKKFNINCPNFNEITHSTISNNICKLLYEKYASDLIPEYPVKIYYGELLPIDIIYRGLTYIYYNTNITRSEIEQLFPKNQETEKDIKRESDFLHQENEKKVIDGLFKDLPPTTVILLEKANYFYSLLTSLIGYQGENPNIVIDRDNAVPLSILLSLFSCAKEYSVEDKINEYEELTLYLESKGINMDSILTYLNIDFEDADEEEKINLVPLMTIFKPYFEGDGTISIFEVFSRLFDRNISPQPVIQKILLEHNLDPEFFKNYQMDKNFLERQKMQSKIVEMNIIRDKYFNSDVDSFLCFAVKAYQVILEKVQQGGYNEQLLTNDADCFQLALYFASVYKKHRLGNYLCENGITPEEVLKHLQIDISEQEIMSQKLKPQLYLDIEKEFRHLSDSTLEWATPYFINFSNSLLIDRLICEINPDLFTKIRDSEQNLAYMVTQYENYKKENLSKKRQHRYFKDMPDELVRVLRTASKFFVEINDLDTDYDDKDIISLSLLLSILQDDNSNVRRFLNDKDLHYSKVVGTIVGDDGDSFLVEHDDLDIEDTDEDIDLLIDKYGSIVFGGANQGLKKSDLSIINICKNIFSKSYHIGPKFGDFLESLYLDFDEFKDIDSDFKKYVAEEKHDKAIRRMDRRMDDYQENAKDYIKDVIRIHKRIVDNGKVLNRCVPVELSDEDVEMLSFILALFNSENNSIYQEFLREYQIDQKSILAFIGIDDPSKIYDGLEKDEVSPYIYDEHYEKYAINRDQNGRSMNNLFNALFAVNKSNIFKDICDSLGGNYSVLIKELKNGDLSSLPYLERVDQITIMRSMPIEKLDCNDIKSVLGFGKKLEIYNNYLNTIFPYSLHFELDKETAEKVSKAFDNFIDTTNNKSPSKSRGLFGKRQQNEPTKITGIDENQMYLFTKILEEELEKLKEELLEFADVRTYLEAYRDKNMDYLDVVTNAYEEILNKVDSETVCEILRSKKDKFDIAISSLNRELRIVNQSIVNYFVAINAIEIVKNSLLPVVNVEFETDRNNERTEENNALLECVVKFTKAVLFHDLEGIENFGEQLKSTNAFKDITPAISSEINTLIEGIKASKELEKDSKESKPKAKTISYMAL